MSGVHCIYLVTCTCTALLCQHACLARDSLAALALACRGCEWLVLTPSDLESLSLAFAWRSGGSYGWNSTRGSSELRFHSVFRSCQPCTERSPFSLPRDYKTIRRRHHVGQPFSYALFGVSANTPPLDCRPADYLRWSCLLLTTDRGAHSHTSLAYNARSMALSPPTARKVW